MTHWNTGDQIASRSVENHQIWYGEPATVVQDARDRILQWIVERIPPFDGSWLSWNAPVSWPIPQLPAGWSDL
jgi:hypothetical protein